MTHPSRRTLLQSAALTAASAIVTSSAIAADNSNASTPRKGNIRQSMIQWCYSKYWNEEQMAGVARELGLLSVELIDPKFWPMLKQHGLTCAIAGSHGFVQGMNNPKYQPKCIETIHERIDQCAEFGVKNVITFTGMREDIPAEVGMDNCVRGYKQLMSHAEKKGVNLCLEMLNSRATGYMKGHPGYQGDHTDYCIELIKRVGSERMKLLFDIYHVQIMDGDVITRIRQYTDYIGHVHTAGNPGRGELDDKQEINYKPIMQALLDVGYKGFVGQEFIPTRDPMQGLREAAGLCDV
ncbi:MAG TPA: TIM barrel protein [Tepidisphaeraceae bacterium]|nr:TIM barrel protein [Tepidisphaeraceae bacterium]